MTDYLGPLTLPSTSGSTYQLVSRDFRNGTASLVVHANGSSYATMIAAVDALTAQLRLGNTYAYLFPGATNHVVYTIAGVSDITIDEDAGPLAFWASVSCTLALSAMPAGALTTLYSAQHVDSPASLSLATLLGTHPTALDVTIDDDSGNDMHSVWCALAPTAVSDAKWRVKASSLTWTTMSNGTGATDSWVDGTTRYTTSASYQTAPLDTAAYPQGKYKLLVHVKQSAGTGYVKDSQNDSAVAITRTVMHIMEIGDLDLPVSDTASGTASNLTLSVCSDGTNTITVDAYLLIPLDYGMFRWHHDTVTSEIDQLDVGPSGVFMDGACDTTYLRGGILVPRIMATHVGTLIATPEPSGTTWPSDWGRTSGDRTNYVTNPRLAGAAVPTLFADGSGCHGTPVFTTGDNGDGTNYAQVEYTVVADDLAAAGHNVGFLFTGPADSFAPGDALTSTLEYQLAVSNARSCDAGDHTVCNEDFGDWTVEAFGVAGWTALELNIASLAAGTTSFLWFVRAFIKDSTGVAGDTITLRFRHPQVEKAATPTAFLHGSMPDSAWVGATDGSLSTKGEVSSDATGLLFQVSTTTGSKYATYAATNAATPLVVPGAWYELGFTRNVTARSAGSAVGIIVWQDVDGNTVRTDTLSTTATTDASPTAITVYAKAPAHAARAQVKLGAGAGANLTAAFSAVVLRRCPLRLIVVAEDAGGAVATFVHPVHVTLKYRPAYEVGR